jgi:hypothetical protein
MENYIEKYSMYKNKISYPSRASADNKEYRCVYPEGGHGA